MEIIVSVVNLQLNLGLNNKVGKDKGGGGRHRWCSKPFESDPPLHPFFLDHWMKAQLPALGWYPERKEIKSHILSILPHSVPHTLQTHREFGLSRCSDGWLPFFLGGLLL